MNYTLQIRRMGESGILIDWPQRIDENILDDILQFKLKLSETYHGKFYNLTHSYASILIHMRDTFIFEEEKERIQQEYIDCEAIHLSSHCWHIPVCYDEEYGVDQTLYTQKDISINQLIEWHTAPLYRIYMIGFLPGFPYLGGLDSRLYMDRQSIPRSRIKKGSVAIGGKQTGVYTQDSPGGWNIIGQTPFDFFDINRPNPCPMQAGDQIRFYSVSKMKFEKLKML